MKVKELLSKLKKVDQELDILCFCEDENILTAPNQLFQLFEIIDTSTTDAEKRRSEDGVPGLKFCRTEHSTPHVFIDITSDF